MRVLSKPIRTPGRLFVVLLASGLFVGCAQGPRTAVSRLRDLPRNTWNRAATQFSRIAQSDRFKSERYARQADRSGNSSAARDIGNDASGPADRPHGSGSSLPSGKTTAKDDERASTKEHGGVGGFFASLINKSSDEAVTEDPFLKSPPNVDAVKTAATRSPESAPSVKRPLEDRSATAQVSQPSKPEHSAVEKIEHEQISNDRFAEGFEVRLDRLRAAIQQDRQRSHVSPESPSAGDTVEPPPATSKTGAVAIVEPPPEMPVSPPLASDPVAPAEEQLSQAGSGSLSSLVEFLPPPPLQEGASPAVEPQEEIKTASRAVQILPPPRQDEQEEPVVTPSGSQPRITGERITGEAQGGMIVESDVIPWRFSQRRLRQEDRGAFRSAPPSSAAPLRSARSVSDDAVQ